MKLRDMFPLAQFGVKGFTSKAQKDEGLGRLRLTLLSSVILK